jgi:hypothetical protein
VRSPETIRGPPGWDREAHDRGVPTLRAVVEGIRSTAGVVTIMVAA